MPASTAESLIVNALTVDVEEHFQVAAFDGVIERSDWPTMPSRVEANTHRLLDLFDEYEVRATFFVLGWVAERQSQLIREIVDRGHELACHGYSHQLIYRQSPEVFRGETRRAKDILEQIGQVSVRGYRAASYSITPRSRWALDVLVESGFEYDSSIFPVRHDRYGMPGSERWPHRLNTEGGGKIVEFPLSTLKWRGLSVPIAGGGYFRIYPYSFSHRGLGSINVRDRMPFVFYLHPWEVDPQQPRIRAGALSRFRHYHNLHRCEKRLRCLLEDFRFAAMEDVLEHLNLLMSGYSPSPSGSERVGAS